MEMNVKRERLRFESLAADVSEQVAIEGECALAGSMRDAVTILSVQAQAHITQTQTLEGRVAVKGRACFQVLYTQGDLTRSRAIETTCDFTHELSAPGAQACMRVQARASVLETGGSAGSGRVMLRALLELSAQVIDTREQEALSGIQCAQPLCLREQTVTIDVRQLLGEETALVREEFDLPARLQIEGVLTATGTASVTDITGGSGRVGVSGVIDVRVLHQNSQPGEALVETVHELPFQVTLSAQLAEDARPQAIAEVIDVMADSILADKQRTMRVEAEVRVRLELCEQRSMPLLEDFYTTDGPLLEPQTAQIDVYACAQGNEARESARIQATLPADAPPLDTVLAAFAQPALSSLAPSGRRLGVEGVMNVTLVYLPVDSDIPFAVRTREPFAMTFPVEAEEGVRAQVQAIECGIGPATSDRVELRCVLALRTEQPSTRRVRIVTDVTERPEEKREHGFVLVWPAPGETRWDTARRLRVPQESLRPAGASALLAFRR